MKTANRSLARLMAYTDPRQRVADLLESGRHGTLEMPDATLGWAIEQVRQKEVRQERLPYKDA
jgi:hypothetical protein